MFSDPFTAVMALILLAFIGTLAVFLRIWRELDSLRASIRELKDGMQFYAVDASQQNRDIVAALRELRATGEPPVKAENRAGEACLGELLEKGLPNLVPDMKSFSEPRITLASSGRQEDEDLIRRLGDGINMGAAQK